MGLTPITVLLLRRATRCSKNPKVVIFDHLLHHFLKPYSTSSVPDPPSKPSSLSARMSFIFDQIDAIERERAQKDETLQRIRAWRHSKNPEYQNPETVISQKPETTTLQNEVQGFKSGCMDSGDSSSSSTEINGSVELLKKKTEMEVVHPWPEWIELMERLVHQNYFDHRRKNEDKLVQDSGFDAHEVGNDDCDVGIDFNDFKTVQNACVNFGKDRFDILRSLSRHDIQILVGYGCPSADKKVAFSAKLLRKHVHLDEGDVCSNCSLRSSCEKAYLLTNKEDEARTIDIMRVLLNYGFDPINGSVVNKSLLKQKSLRTVVRKVLHEVVKLSAVPIDPNLPPPVIKKPPPKVKQPPPPPKRRVGRDDVEMKKGDWVCPKCDFMNFAKNTVCLQCDAKRPKRQLLPGEWECPECNFLNYRRNTVCFHCECKRPPDEFVEHKMEDKGHVNKTRLEKIGSRAEVSNAWNFDFDDDESDGADVAAFEYADPAAMEENSPLHTRAQGGSFRGLDEDFNIVSKISRFAEREYSEASHIRPGVGFDDFADEDDIDSYELDNENSGPAWNASHSNSSQQGTSEFEGDEYSDNNLRAQPRNMRPSKSMHKKSSFSGSEDNNLDMDSDEELSVHPKWKSSHVADTGHRNRSRGPTGPSKRLSFGSDEEIDLGSDSDAEKDFGSNKWKGNKQGLGRRNYERNSNFRNASFSGSESENDQLYSQGNRPVRNKIEAGGRRNDFRGRGDHAVGRDTRGRTKGKVGDRRNSRDDDFDRSSHRSRDSKGGFRVGDRRRSWDDDFDRSSHRSRDGKVGFRGNHRPEWRVSDRGGNFSKFQGPKQVGFRNGREGRSCNYNMDKDFGEFRNSRRVIER